METFGKFNRCWTNRTQTHCMVEVPPAQPVQDRRFSPAGSDSTLPPGLARRRRQAGHRLHRPLADERPHQQEEVASPHRASPQTWTSASTESTESSLATRISRPSVPLAHRRLENPQSERPARRRTGPPQARQQACAEKRRPRQPLRTGPALQEDPGQAAHILQVLLPRRSPPRQATLPAGRAAAAAALAARSTTKAIGCLVD